MATEAEVDLNEEEVVVEEEAAEDDFEGAFDEAIEADEEGEETPPTEEAEELEGEAEEEEPTPEEKEEEVVEEEPAKEEETPAKGEEAEAVDTLDQVKHKYDTVSGMYNSEVRKRQKLEDELALLKEGKAPKPEEEEPGEPKKEVSESLEDALMDKISGLDSVKALTDEYDDEMPKALKDIAGLIHKEVAGDFEKRFGILSEALKPLHEDHDRASGEAHFNAVEKAHPDFESLEKPLKAWIDGKPSYMRPALENVYADGSVEDVNDLFTTFKAETNYKAPVKKEKPEEKIDTDKLEDMETVDAKKSPVSSGKRAGASKDDFEAGWDDAK